MSFQRISIVSLLLLVVGATAQAQPLDADGSGVYDAADLLRHMAQWHQETTAPTSGLVHEEYLPTSLHGTARGMRTLYEREDGAGPLFGVDYDDVSCKECHVYGKVATSKFGTTGCNVCHASLDYEENSANCEKCHGRVVKEGAKGFEDVHRDELGFTCTNCHDSAQMHGDGNEYASMLVAEAPRARCVDCHAVEDIVQNTAHATHGSDFDCSACHVKSVITCYNCHFETQVELDQKKAFNAFSDFVLLLNDSEGKVTTGSYQTATYNGKKFVVFAPYHGHSVSREARECADCHGAGFGGVPAIQELVASDQITIASWENDTISHAKGVIPLVDGKMKLQFLGATQSNPGPGDWTQLEGDADQVQYAYCTPLSATQVKAIGGPDAE